MKDIKSEKKSKLDSAFWLYKLTKTAVYIEFFFCLLLFLFYLIGNYQGFMDSTQLLILTVLGFSSVAEVVLSLLGLIELVFFMITDNFSVKYIFRILFMLFTFLVSIILLIYSVIIKRFSVGV